MTTTSSSTFFSQLEARCRAANTLLCVGLDPHVDDLPKHTTNEEGAKLALEFCTRIITNTSAYTACYKPNAAFFEVFGAPGIAALNQVIQAVPLGIPVLLDAKRGDISTTAQAYAQACFTTSGAHAVTVNAYMGYDSVEPFAKYLDRGVFVLCKTSNPTSSEFASGMFERVASKCASEWGEKTGFNLGLVVGATDTHALARTRALAPNTWILAPGIGFQGGDLELALGAGLRASDGLGLLPAVSRGISRAKNQAETAQNFRDEINRVRAAGGAHAKRQHQQQEQQPQHQKMFFDLAHSCGVLKFGEFTLKSGRKSPYFFNAGLFNTGRAAHELAVCYAQTIHEARTVDFNLLFGPAYKGIPLVATVAAELFSRFGTDCAFAYNRKEEKDHGEGGGLVGAAVGPGTKALILDDVITAGTAVRESIALLQRHGAQVVGLVVAIDRQEVASGDVTSAVEAVKKEFGIAVLSIVTLDALLVWAENLDKDVVRRIAEYRETYGVKRGAREGGS
jgi:uridine monophosphate synthetase